MLRVVTVSSRGERGSADALAALVRASWPWIDGSATEHVTIAAGIKLVRESDLLLTFTFDRPRAIGPVARRDGSLWSGTVHAGAIVVEVKWHDPSRLAAIGNDLRPSYGGKPSRETVLEQLQAQLVGVARFLERYEVERCFVHGLAWMRGVTEAELLAGNPALAPAIVASDVSFEQMLAAAASEHLAIGEPQNEAYCRSVRFLEERLTREREMSARDLARLDALTTGVLVRDVLDDVMAHLGMHQIRLVGRAGSGKSTTLALLARRAVQRDGGRVLFLTYQRVLRGELEHLVRGLSGGAGIAPGSIVVATLIDFLLDAFTELGGTVPTTASGAIDYAALPAALREFAHERGAALACDAETLRQLFPERFAFDFVFVDEAQDWRDAQRDLLRALFPPERTVLADGLEQFAQRQSRCDWLTGVPRETRYVRELNRSLRMSGNVARFVNAFAGAMGHIDWRIQPHPELVGGRVIIARDGTDRAELLARVLEIARDAGVSPGDCLIASPPRESGEGRTPTHETIREELAAMGYAAWDATDEQTRTLTRQPDEVALVPYGSLRGLEGWATVLVGLDRAYENKLRHPNLEPDEATSAEDVARNAMLLAVTRVAHVLAITIGDDASPVAAWIDEAARACGEGIVERM